MGCRCGVGTGAGASLPTCPMQGTGSLQHSVWFQATEPFISRGIKLTGLETPDLQFAAHDAEPYRRRRW